MPTPEVLPEPEIVEFTAVQQTKLDEIIKKAMGRAGSESRQELATATAKIVKLEADLAEAKKAATTGPAADRSAAKGEVADLQAQIDEMKNARTATVAEIEGLRKQITDANGNAEKAKADTLKERKLNVIANAASKEDFVNIKVVRALTEGNLQWNETDGKWTVLSDEGQPRMNSAYDPMTIDEFYADFAAKNPYLVKGSVKPGTGSSESTRSTLASGRYTVEQIFGKGSNAKLANELAIKNNAEYKRLRAEAIQKGIVA